MSISVEIDPEQLNKMVVDAILNSSIEEKHMLDYQQRVVDEKSELDKKLFALTTFLQGDVYAKMPAGRAKGLMVEQHTAMEDYSRVLAKRIALFSDTQLPPDGAPEAYREVHVINLKLNSWYWLLSIYGEWTLAYYYDCKDAETTGFGFNIKDGGGFLPIDEILSTTRIFETFKS